MSSSSDSDSTFFSTFFSSVRETNLTLKQSKRRNAKIKDMSHVIRKQYHQHISRKMVILILIMFHEMHCVTIESRSNNTPTHTEIPPFLLIQECQESIKINFMQTDSPDAKGTALVH
jgi:hypothetical protein